MISERIWRRAAVWLAAASALCLAGIRPAHAVSTSIVISQAYGGGGNSGSTWKNDFVELYNLGSTAVDVTGWTIQYASAAGNFPATLSTTNSTTLTGTIQPGKYFLVQEAAGTGGTTSLPTPDVIGSIPMGGTGFKVALVNNGTALGAAPCPTGPSIVDFLGAGTSANCSETAAAPAPSNTTADLRAGNPRGAIDTDNNASDFTAGAPDPRNSSYGGGTTGPSVTNVVVNPTSGDPGTNGVTISATVTPGTNSATISTVTVNLTPVGGSATAPMTNSAGTWSATFNVGLSATAGEKSLAITATDAGSPAKTGTASGTFSVNSVVPPLTVAQARALGANATAVTVRGVVVSNTSGSGQIYINDPDGGAGIQVFKSALTMPIGELVDATGPLQYFRGELELAATLVTDRGATTPLAPAAITIPQMVTIGPSPAFAHPNEGRLLNLSNVTVTKASSTTTASGTTYNIADDSGNTAVVFVPAQATAATLSNPITVTTLQAGFVYNIAGCLSYFGATTGETRDNPTLFELKPRDANDVTNLGAALIQSVVADPSVVSRGTSTTITATLSQPSGASVKADLTALGGSATQAFSDNGGGVFTLSVPVSASQAYGPVTVNVTATFGTSTLSAPVTLTIVTDNQNVTIAQARALPDYSLVTVSGNLTANGTTGTNQVYIQDTSGAKGMSGVYLFDGQGRGLPFTYGDIVTVTAFKVTFNGGVELDYTGTYNGSNPAESAGSAPAPVTLTQTQWPGYPGVLSQTNSLQIISGSGTSNATYWATDGTSFGQVFLSSKAGITTALTVGTAYNLTGIVDFFNNGTTNAWQFKPRSSSDIATGTSPAVIPTQVVVTTQPVGGAPGAALTTQPVVAVKDAGGNAVASFTGPVSIAIKAGTGTTGAVLSGTTTVNAVGGVATFSGLSIDLAGTGYILTATSGPYSADTTAFNVATAAIAGDIDKDGSVTVSDALLALKVAAGLVNSADPTVNFGAGNVAPKGAVDGAIDILDALRILRSVKNLDTLP